MRISFNGMPSASLCATTSARGTACMPTRSVPSVIVVSSAATS